MGTDNPAAHHQYICPKCGIAVSGAVIAKTTETPPVAWIRCTRCNRGAVLNGFELSPTGIEGEPVDGLPEDIAAAYEEARKTAAIAAYTSCELMCRKILMHVAVQKGAKPGKSFAEYLSALADAGYVTPPMRPWVDQIRKNGNIATHELPPTDRDRALNTLAFTTQLLRLIYEMEHRFKQANPLGAIPSQPAGA